MERQPSAPKRLWHHMIVCLADRPWLIVLACTAVLVLTGFIVFTLGRVGSIEARCKAIDERLRIIDAAHIIPEEENAARLYTELAWDPNLPSWDPALLPQGVLSITMVRPWRGVEFPQVAQWVDERQGILNALLAATRTPQCWFSVFDARWQLFKRSNAGGEWPALLLQAANRDLGEGHADAGLEKLLGLFRMAQHFLAQSSPGDYLIGKGMASMGLKRFARLVIKEEVPPEWLARLEAALPPIKDTLKERARQVDEVGILYLQEIERSPLERLKHIFSPQRYPRGVRESDRIFLGQCRTARILLALRRHRNETGAWPATLGELGPRLPPEVLRDPLSGKPFVYRPTADGFLLYSLSTNGTDEGGKFPGDFLFWPRQ